MSNSGKKKLNELRAKKDVTTKESCNPEYTKSLNTYISLAQKLGIVIPEEMQEEILNIMIRKGPVFSWYKEPKFSNPANIVICIGLRIIRDLSNDSALFKRLVQHFVDAGQMERRDTDFFLNINEWADERMREKRNHNYKLNIWFNDAYYDCLLQAIMDVGVIDYTKWYGSDIEQHDAILYQLSIIQAQIFKDELSLKVIKAVCSELFVEGTILDSLIVTIDEVAEEVEKGTLQNLDLSAIDKFPPQTDGSPSKERAARGDVFAEIAARIDSQYEALERGVGKFRQMSANDSKKNTIPLSEILRSEAVYKHIREHGVYESDIDEIAAKLNMDNDACSNDWTNALLCLTKALVETGYEYNPFKGMKINVQETSISDFEVHFKNGIHSDNYILFPTMDTAVFYVWDKTNMILRSYTQEMYELVNEYIKLYKLLNK